MTKIVLTAQVDNLEEWEEGFRTHGNLFKSQGLASPILIGTTGDNEVALYEEVAYFDSFTKALESPETAEAMAHDGVRRETVKIFVLDKELSF